MVKDTRRKERIWEQEEKGNSRQLRQQCYQKTKTWPEELRITAAELMRWKIFQGKDLNIDKGRKHSIKRKENRRKENFLKTQVQGERGKQKNG